MLGGMTGLPCRLAARHDEPPAAGEADDGRADEDGDGYLRPATDRKSAPGAVTTVGFKYDTTLKGPWDRAALLHGTN